MHPTVSNQPAEDEADGCAWNARIQNLTSGSSHAFSTMACFWIFCLYAILLFLPLTFSSLTSDATSDF